MPKEATTGVRGFRGLHERLIQGETQRETFTSSLNGVIVRNGVVSGRKGVALWDGISAAATNQIIGLADFYAPASATSSLLRMQTLAMEKWNDGTNAWDDITGTALTGDTNTRPVFHTMSDEGFLVFTNEGHDRPRKYTGSGNTAVLGGTPPYAKWLCPYVGFLFLFNTSTDGTFSATADSITAYFSDVPDGEWDLCSGNVIIFDESPGEIRAAQVFNDYMVVFKSDALVRVQFTGGAVGFSRRALPFNLGILAPLSLKRIGESGLIFLATDRNLYITDGFKVTPLPPNVQKTLQETMAAARAPYCSAAVDLTRETYHLLYSKNATTYFDGRLSFNYRTGEFYKSEFTGYEWTRIHAYRLSNNVDSQIIAAANDKKVYEMESGTDDAGTRVTRYYDFDWTQFSSPGSKYFTGANFVFKKAANCAVRISVAVDHSSKFQYARTFNLKSFDTDDDNVRVEYQVPSPINGSWFKIRVEMKHYGATNTAQMLEFEPVVIPISRSVIENSNQAQAQRD